MDEQNATPNEQGTPQIPTPPASPYEQAPVNNQQVPPANQQGNPYQQQAPYYPQGYPQTPPQGGSYQPPYQQGGTYQQPPYQQGGPYQQPYQQGNPYQQPQGYSYWQQGQQYPVNQNKSKVWPWVLIACLVLALVGLGGCVGCVACTAMLSEQDSRYDYYDDYYGYDYGYDYDDYYGYDYDDDYYAYDSTYTLADIESLVTTEKSEIVDGKCSTGLYIVGKDIDPGLYFLEGSQSEEGSFYIFDEESTDSYVIDAVVAYYGNYFAELESGDVILFSTPTNALMYPATADPVEVADPIQSGLYRVGTDIPAGTYTVTYQTGAPTEASQESGIYIMKDLNWDEDSIIEDHYLIEGGSHTVTLVDGQYVELFLATMKSA